MFKMTMFAVLCLVKALSVFGQSSQSIGGSTVKELPPFPKPLSIIEDSKKFNAVEIGPNNSLTIRRTPSDFSLASIALSSDGRRVAIGWESGREEVREVNSGRKITDFRALTNDALFSHEDDWLITAGTGGEIRVTDIASGKKVKELQAELGKLKYDVRRAAYMPEADYWAYVDGEEGRVVRLTDGRVEASLGDATDFRLSADGKRFWTVSRERVAEYESATWSLRKEWKLRLPISPTSEPELEIGTDSSGNEFAAVPSVGGLALYSESPGKEVTLEAGRPFIDSADQLLLVSGKSESLFDMKGNLLCQWQQRPAHRFTSSADGRWIAFADFDKVSIWSFKDLATNCGKH